MRDPRDYGWLDGLMFFRAHGLSNVSMEKLRKNEKKIEEKNRRAERNQSMEAWYVTPHRRRSLEAPRKMLQLNMLATQSSCLQIVQKDRTKNTPTGTRKLQMINTADGC